MVFVGILILSNKSENRLNNHKDFSLEKKSAKLQMDKMFVFLKFRPKDLLICTTSQQHLVQLI